MSRYRIALDVANIGVLENYRVDVARGVIRYARQHTEWELFYNLGDYSLIHWYENFEDLARLNADGIIFSYWERRKVRAIERLGIPMVSLTNLDPGLSGTLSCVLSDDTEAGRLAAHHFLERGFRHFAFYGDTASRRWEAERLRGFAEVLGKAGHTCHTIRGQRFGEPPVAARKLSDWLAKLPRPLAIFGGTDNRAFHILESCRDLGLAVPLDVAILGVDNNPFLCEAQHVSLSSVAPDSERVGFEAGALLHRMLEGLARGGRPKLEQVIVAPRGVVTRASSDVVAADDPALSRALLFIRARHTDSIGIDDIVEASGVSRSTLERRVRARTGLSLNDALRRQRLDTARALLRDQRLSLQQVAEASGFRRSTYLCNVFREVENQTPREWQRNAL